MQVRRKASLVERRSFLFFLHFLWNTNYIFVDYIVNKSILSIIFYQSIEDKNQVLQFSIFIYDTY